MKGLNLRKESEDVVLPPELAVCGLTLAQIGAVFVLHAIVGGSITSEQVEELKIKTKEFRDTIAELSQMGVLSLEQSEDGVHLHLDIQHIEYTLDEDDLKEISPNNTGPK